VREDEELVLPPAVREDEFERGLGGGTGRGEEVRSGEPSIQKTSRQTEPEKKKRKKKEYI
jgi:hypothetical protein